MSIKLVFTQSGCTGGMRPGKGSIKRRYGHLCMIFFTLACLAAGSVARGEIVINEIHYGPEPRNDLLEFVELHNTGPDSVDLEGWSFTDGISFVFPSGSLVEPHGYAVVAENPGELLAIFGVSAYGPFSGQLSGQGERVVLRDAQGAITDEVDYGVNFPWPTAADGAGPSMELVDPSLDNDLGGSWRSAGYRDGLGPLELLIGAQSPGWHFRKGTSEASDPIDAWRQIGFVEDGSWLQGQTPIGSGKEGLNTELTDMLGNYTTVYLRYPFDVADPAALPAGLKLYVYAEDGCIVWINGQEAARLHVTAGDKPYNGTASAHAAEWETVTLENGRDLLVTGANVVAVHVLVYSPRVADFVFDMSLVPEGEADASPTPGRRNSTRTSNAAPQVRQVEHAPRQPTNSQPIAISAKVTDPDGVASVVLSYQIVAPGQYMPALNPLPIADLLAVTSSDVVFEPNPDFEDPANWSTLEMTDDGLGGDEEAGDGVYTALMPGQPNRTLVRYRIMVADSHGMTLRVPYSDDTSFNFACYVYDGVPPYTAETLSVSGTVPYTYGTNVMRSLPVYSLITRQQYIEECMAYGGQYQMPGNNHPARYVENWEGALVYDGEVYDHIRYRLRGANGRYYLNGRRMMRFLFNRGNEFRARDRYGRRYPRAWRRMNFSKMFDNRLGLEPHPPTCHNFGLAESMNEMLWNMNGVPGHHAHWLHLRVVDGAVEAPSGANGQYRGDFWGMFLAMETYHTQFIDAHGITDGNIYKLSSGLTGGLNQQRVQGRWSVDNAGDYDWIRANLLGGRTEQELRSMVNYDEFFRFYSVLQGVRFYDIWNFCDKNMAWYFNPVEVDAYNQPYGRLWYMPYDHDLTWGPNWNAGQNEAHSAIAGLTGLEIDYRNYLREFRDLLWQPEVVNTMIDDLAAMIAPFVPADRDRWKDAPLYADSGTMDYYTWTLDEKVADMKLFAFTWDGSYNRWPGGDVSPGGDLAGSRATYLDSLANAGGDATSIPHTPSVGYSGPEGYPVNACSFTTTDFSDPQGAGTFGAMKWRIGEISDTNSPSYDPAELRVYEVPAVWESAELEAFDPELAVAPGILRVGRRYRVRARMQDNTSRWSHWSAPLEFTAGPSDNTVALLANLRLTELMYHAPSGSEMDYLELCNMSPESTLDLGGVRFSNGIEYTIPPGATLLPGEYLLVVNCESNANYAAFRSHYGLPEDVRITGPYDGNLSNGGEQLNIKTAFAGDLIVSFEYDDGRGWPLPADGAGHSLVPLVLDNQAGGALDYGRNWRYSARIGGSPGAADAEPPVSARLNEIAAHTDTELPPPEDSDDWIELYNPTAAPVNLADWYLSDDPNQLDKYRFAADAAIAANGFLVLTENLHFHTNRLDGSGFGLSKDGEQVLLSYLPGDERDRVMDWVAFKAQDREKSLGHYPDGVEFWWELERTFGLSNAPPVPGVVIDEIMYNPAPIGTQGVDNTHLEYIEVVNRATNSIQLYSDAGEWRIAGGIDYSFPSNMLLDAGERVLLVRFDPADPSAMAAFEERYGTVDPAVDMRGPYAGTLSDRGERVAVERPMPADNPLLPGELAWAIVDEVIYADQSPWPSSADGLGLSLQRVSAAGHGCDPSNWSDLPPTPGLLPAKAFITWPRDNATIFVDSTDKIKVSVNEERVVPPASRVVFLVDGTSVGEDATEPYEQEMSVITNFGSQVLGAVLEDGEGTYTTRTVSVTALELVDEGAAGVSDYSAEIQCGLYGPAPAAIELYWGRSDAGAAGCGWEHYAVIGTLSNSVLPVAVQSLQPDTRYYYRWKAIAAGGVAGWSEPAGEFRTLSLGGWARGMRVTVPGYDGSSVLTNFPLPLTLGPQIAGFDYADFSSPDGTDLRILDASGALALPYEIERWDTNGTSVVWARVPELAGTNTTLWLLWGSPAAVEAPPYTQDGSAWSAGHYAVWHFNGNLADSVSGSVAVDAGSADAAGVLGRGRSFDGVAAYVRPGINPGWFGVHIDGLTVSLWAKPVDTPHATVFGTSALGADLYMSCQGGRGGHWTFAAGDAANEDVVPNIGSWQHVALVLNNGQAFGSFNGGPPLPLGAYSPFTPEYAPLLGALSSEEVGEGDFFDGSVDELRVSQAARSADWIAAEYASTVPGGSFTAFAPLPLPGIDGDHDGLPDRWEMMNFGGTNVTSGTPSEDADGDGASDAQELDAGTDPNDPADIFRLRIASSGPQVVVTFDTRRPGIEYGDVRRLYTLQSTVDLNSNAWDDVPGVIDIEADNGPVAHTNEVPGAVEFFRGRTRLE